MRVVRSLVLLLTLLVVPALASAQRPPDRVYPDAGARDTTRFLPTWLTATAQGGIGWIASPALVRRSYSPGMNFGVSFATTPERRVRAGISLEFHDMPANTEQIDEYYRSVVDTSTSAPPPMNLYDDGNLIDALATVAFRPFGPFWIQGGIGWGRFDATGSRLSFGRLDPFGTLYVERMETLGKVSWGAVAAADLRYEFQPTPRDRLFFSAGWRSMEHLGERVHVVPLRIGYRFQ